MDVRDATTDTAAANDTSAKNMPANNERAN